MASTFSLGYGFTLNNIPLQNDYPDARNLIDEYVTMSLLSKSTLSVLNLLCVGGRANKRYPYSIVQTVLTGYLYEELGPWTHKTGRG